MRRPLAAIVVCALWHLDRTVRLRRDRPYIADARPSWSHHLGTDELGRDILSRIIYGARASVIVCITAALLSLALSVTLGFCPGYFGGRSMPWFSGSSIPGRAFSDLIVLIAGVAVSAPGSCRSSPSSASLYGVAGSRIVRGAVLSAREQLYVQAGHSFGAGNGHIILRHILPTIAAPLIVFLHHAPRRRDPGRIESQLPLVLVCHRRHPRGAVC